MVCLLPALMVAKVHWAPQIGLVVGLAHRRLSLIGPSEVVLGRVGLHAGAHGPLPRKDILGLW